MTIYFTPPTVEHVYVIDRATALTWTGSDGVSVLREGGAYRQVLSPSQVELEAADAYYLGGHRYEITADERTDLTAAGYSAYIEEV